MTQFIPHFTDGETEAQKVQVTCLKVAARVRGRTWIGSWASQPSDVSSSTPRSPQPWPDICVFTPVGAIDLLGGQWWGALVTGLKNTMQIFSGTQRIFYKYFFFFFS